MEVCAPKEHVPRCADDHKEETPQGNVTTDVSSDFHNCTIQSKEVTQRCETRIVHDVKTIQLNIGRVWVDG